MALDLSKTHALLPCAWLVCKLAAAAVLCAFALPSDVAEVDGLLARAARAVFVLTAVFESAVDARVLRGNAAFEALARRTVLGSNTDIMRDVLAFALLQAAYRPLAAPAATAHPAVYSAVAAWGLCAAGITAVDVARAVADRDPGDAPRTACLAVCTGAFAAAVASPAFHAVLASEGLGALLCAAACYTALCAVRLYAARAGGSGFSGPGPEPPACSPNALVHGWLFFAPSLLVLGALALANAAAIAAGVLLLPGIHDAPPRPRDPLPKPHTAPAPEARQAQDPFPALSKDTLQRMREMEAAVEATHRRSFA